MVFHHARGETLHPERDPHRRQRRSGGSRLQHVHDGSGSGDLLAPADGTGVAAEKVIKGVDKPVAAGQYNKNVTFGAPTTGEEFTEEAIGTLTINEHSTDAASAWVALKRSIDSTEVSTVTDVVAESDRTAFEDTVVVEIEASGLYGYLSDSKLVKGSSGTDYRRSLTFEGTNPGSNTDAMTFDASANGVTLVPDAQNNTLYAVVNTSADFTGQYSPSTADAPEPGDTYKAVFTVENEGGNGNPLLATDASESVNTTFSLDKRSASFDQDTYSVLRGSVNVSGMTLLVPGSSLTVQARSSENNPTLLAV